MSNRRRTTWLLIGAGVAFTGCSAKGPITSQRQALEARLELVSRATGAAAAFRSPAVAATDAAPIVSSSAPLDDSNTLVIEDADVRGFDTEVDCAALSRRGEAAGNPACGWMTFGAGDECAKEVASVLKFDHFRNPEAPRTRASVETCARWLLGARYALLVHFDKQRGRRDSDDKEVSGWAVLHDLGADKPLGRVPFFHESQGRREDAIVARTGQRTVHTIEEARGFDILVREALGAALTKAFPNARVERWK